VLLFGERASLVLRGVTTAEPARRSYLGRVLFICVRNSARSQMAAAFLKRACPSELEVESAGLEPGSINPLAVATMQEVGIDISGNSTQSVFDVFKSGKLFTHVITVCDEASAPRCPIFPGIVKRLHWSIADPAALKGTWEDQVSAVRSIRHEIRDRVDALCEELCYA
jgi:arsenate reductase